MVEQRKTSLPHGLPWTQETGSKTIHDRDGVSVASCQFRTRSAFIVTACNAHEELLAALRSIDTIASQSGDTFRDLTHPKERNETIRDIARAALAKAGAAG